MIIGAFEENGLTNSETVLFARRFLKEKRGGVMKELKRRVCVCGGGGGGYKQSKVCTYTTIILYIHTAEKSVPCL